MSPAATLAWVGAAFSAAPEGLMTGYAVWLDDGSVTVGLLLAAMPLGTVCAAVLYGRFTTSARRWRLVPVMALLSCASLIPVLLNPPLPVLLVLLVQPADRGRAVWSRSSRCCRRFGTRRFLLCGTGLSRVWWPRW